MTQTPLSKSKGQGHQAALLTAVLMREAGAATLLRTYWEWEITSRLREGGAGAYRVATRTACFIVLLQRTAY